MYLGRYPCSYLIGVSDQMQLLPRPIYSEAPRYILNTKFTVRTNCMSPFQRYGIVISILPLGPTSERGKMISYF